MKRLINLTEFLRYYPDRLARFVLRFYGYKSFFVETAIVKHHVYSFKDKGSLPPLYILHGGSDSAASYLPVLLRLRHKFSEVVVVEAGGHGLSGELKDPYTFDAHYSSTFTVLDKLIKKGGPAIIFGNSLGGLTALHYAVNSPDRVKGLFLTSPMGAPMTEEMLNDLRDIFTPADLKETAIFTNRVLHKPPLLGAYVVNRLTYIRITQPAIMDLIYATSTDDGISAQQLKAIKAPVFMICGRSDRIITHNACRFFKDNLANATIIRPNAVGHCPHIERPKFLANKVVEFATGLSE
ncbi:MAG TPA: alpha/beta hydrolase [Candidatus Saccharimonadales bacterium]|nr:alpha/beta hydrolase [Candidatus Saccharimonadales bacterium]